MCRALATCEHAYFRQDGSMQSGRSMRLYCLRHFHAARPVPGQRDYDRPLDAKGMAQSERIRDWITQRGLVFSTVLASPAQRTRQTVAAIGLRSADERIVWLPDLYEAEPEVYMRHLSEGGAGDATLVVGHNPGMEEFLVQLCGPDTPAPLAAGLGTGALAIVEIGQGGVRAGNGRLVELISPKAL